MDSRFDDNNINFYHLEFNQIGKLSTKQNPILDNIRQYLEKCETTPDLLTLATLLKKKEKNTIFLLPFTHGLSCIDREELKVGICAFNRKKASVVQEKNENSKKVLIYYFSEVAQIQKIKKISEVYNDYQLIVVLSKHNYTRNVVGEGLKSTLQNNENVGLVLHEGDSIPVHQQILEYIKLDNKLDDYCKKRAEEPQYLTTFIFNFGYSREVKIKAARALQDAMRGKKTLAELQPYIPALSQGRLNEVYQEYLSFDATVNLNQNKVQSRKLGI